MRFARIFTCLSLAATLYGQSIVTPVFVHKDGEAAADGYAGLEKEIVVDGGSEQVVGWITFQTEGVDLSEVASATLALYLKALDNPGTLDVYPLTSPVTSPENSLALGSLPLGTTAIASVTLGTADVEKVVHCDIVSALTENPFYGIALVSEDGLLATFDAKEGDLAPVILLTHDVESAASKIFNGSGAPAVDLGKDGDYFLENVTGDVYAKSGGAWNVVTNLVGPQGTQGDPGVAFDDDQVLGDKTWSSQKIQSIVDGKTAEVSTALAEKVDKQAGKGLSTQDYTTAEKSKLAGIEAGAQANLVGTAKGDMQYWDGTQWVMIPSGLPGQALTLSGLSVPQWSQVPGTVTDIDGNVYRTIVIGNQEWTVSNIRTTHYRNGDEIDFVTENFSWSQHTTGAYCYYENTNDASEQKTWGALYNWYAVNDSRGLAPEGWRVPTDADWDALLEHLISNGYNYDGTMIDNKIAKSMAVGNWSTSTNVGAIGNILNANNKSGFSGQASGYRSSNTGVFEHRGSRGPWWSSTGVNSMALPFAS